MDFAASKKRRKNEELASDSGKKTKVTQWWQKGPIYHIYPKSFCDSSGNGIGDLRGIISKTEYLRELNVVGAWLSPIFKSPMIDNGYDIEDYTNIDDIFGNLDDFKELVDKFMSLDLKLILDFVPNHTSDQHVWFQKSRLQEEPYTDFYIWHPGLEQGSKPPCNWKSVFGGSAWEYDNTRISYYLHQFYKQQPDLNLRNAQVRLELQKVLRFWLDLGVSGFRIDAVPHFFEDERFIDEEIIPGKPTESYESVARKYTYNLQPDVNDLLAEFRQVLDEYTRKDGSQRIIMTEGYVGNEELIGYCGKIDESGTGNISHLPINFNLVSNFKSAADLTASKLKVVINDYLECCKKVGAWPNFSLGNHDTPRGSTRFGQKLAAFGMNVLLLLLPGTPLTYYGEEIGMLDNAGDMQCMSESRDPCRSPMQWDGTENAGFSCCETTWLPVNSSYKSGLHVANQEKESNEESSLKVYKKALKLRRQFEDAILYGSCELSVADTVLIMERRSWKKSGLILLLNCSQEEASSINLQESLPTVKNFRIILTNNVGCQIAPGESLVMSPQSFVVLDVY